MTLFSIPLFFLTKNNDFCLFSFSDFDLDEIYDRGSVVSGKSSSLGESIDPTEGFKNSQINGLAQVVTRTVSCPENMSTLVKNLSLTNQNTTENQETTISNLGDDTESQTQENNEAIYTENL